LLQLEQRHQWHLQQLLLLPMESAVVATITLQQLVVIN